MRADLHKEKAGRVLLLVDLFLTFDRMCAIRVISRKVHTKLSLLERVLGGLWLFLFVAVKLRVKAVT